MTYGLRYFSPIAVFLLWIGCSGDDITNPDQIVFPATGVSYRQHIAPLFTISCNVQGCHDAPRPDNFNTDLTSWTGIRSINVVNQPYDTACGLVRVVYGRESHPGPLRINDNHREGIKQWVLEGAQDN